MQKRAYPYRVYPTDEQRAELERTFGSVRFVYNWAISRQRETYQETCESLSYNHLSARLTMLKQETATCWLQDVSSVPLQQALRHVHNAFQGFFSRRSHYSRFKTKRNRQAATYMAVAYSWDGQLLKLAKMDAPLDIRWSRRFSGTPSSVTVTKDRAGRYFISFVVEEPIAPKPPSDRAVGPDLGLHSLLVTSEGKKVAHPRFFSRDESKLARLHQALSRKQSGSSNRGKARAKLARASVRHTDRRLDFTHKLTTTLVNENQVICVESRNVKNLLRHRSRAKSISDAGWGELLRQLEYKAAWYGRSLVRIPQFFPSSKRCSNCGFTLADLPLNVRTWTCSQCGVHHDRDHNAAKNILAAGLAASACGEAARPKRETPVAARLSEAGSAGERSPALYALRGGSDSQESAALPDGG